MTFPGNTTAPQRWATKVSSGWTGECWEWTGARNNKGYGNFWNGERHVSAHVFSYQIFWGEIPEGMVVRHRCDNPPCTNPEHLLIGTHTQNFQDARDRGRLLGTKPRITDAQVAEIRERYRPGNKHHPGNASELMEEFGITSYQYLGAIARGDRR